MQKCGFIGIFCLMAKAIKRFLLERGLDVGLHKQERLQPTMAVAVGNSKKVEKTKRKTPAMSQQFHLTVRQDTGQNST